MNEVYIIENFIEDKDLLFINEMINFIGVSRHDSIPQMRDSEGAMVNVTNMYVDINKVEDLSQMCEAYLSIAHKKLESIYNIKVDKEEGLGVTALGVGHLMPLHVDKGYGDKESNHNFKTPSGFPTREISSLIYWNDNYLGGEICFPNQSITLKPKAGTLILFPSDNNFPHKVLPVKEGLRYVSTNFWHCVWN